MTYLRPAHPPADARRKEANDDLGYAGQILRERNGIPTTPPLPEACGMIDGLDDWETHQ